ncbi:MAG: anaerobic ribonucleoside-triphosphate reductase activating protein [Flavobacteriaceae bacterium]|nr:anaerobic ribonucleoside-triphosphate reductase activating protein [Flavobacteriaceae bacterium]
MNYYQFDITFQEVPGEISLCFSITGCKLQCKGCHSTYLWNANNGKPLLKKNYLELLKQYKGYASCVLFMGGEWHKEKLIEYLSLAKQNNFKTCLYTGEETVPKAILNELTWIKTGKWITAKGGLDNPDTNQKFIYLRTNTIHNHLFLKKQHHD